jgi:hypothetical protein
MFSLPCSHATQRFSEVAGKCTRWNFYRKLKLFLKRICTSIIFTFHVLRPGEFWNYWLKSHLHHDCFVGDFIAAYSVRRERVGYHAAYNMS